MVPNFIAPFSGEAERRFCGALLIFRERIADVMIDVKPDDIYLSQCRWIYESICSLYIDGFTVNIDTVAEHLKNKSDGAGKSRFDSIGGDYLVDIVSGVESDEIDYWIEIIKTKAHERKILDFLEDAKTVLFQGKRDVKTIQSYLEEKLISIVPDNKSQSISIENSIDSLDEVLDKYFNDPDGISGISSGYGKLDELSDGFKPGNVTILYAPSSRFKSLFATNLGYNLAQQNIPGLWFTTEMPRQQVMERLLQLQIKNNLKKLRKDGKIRENMPAIKSHKAALAAMPIYFCDISAPEIGQIKADVQRFKRWHDIEYIIVDLVDHVYSSNFKDEMINNQRYVMAQMKGIAKDFNIHVILVSHIAKQRAEDRNQVDLDVESMIGSSAKYQDVDMAMSIAPWEVVRDKNGVTSKVAMSRDTMAWHMATYTDIPLMLAVTKNRHGPLGMVPLSVQMSRGGIIVEAT